MKTLLIPFRLFVLSFTFVVYANATVDNSVLDATVTSDINVRQQTELKKHLKSSCSDNAIWCLQKFATSAYSLNIELKAANDSILLLRDNIVKKKIKNSHWHIYLLARLYSLYSSVSPQHRMNEEAEKALIESLYDYLQNSEYVSPTMVDSEYIWTYQGSENHHLQAYASAWAAAHILKELPKYLNVDINGEPIQQFAKQLDEYLKKYFKERATKGLFSEIASPTYSKYSLNAILSFYDFASDDELKRLADMFLTVYYADWGLEQKKGLRGGSKHRAYPGQPSYRLKESIGWIPFGLGTPASHPAFLSSLTTSWRPSRTLDELIGSDKGKYEIISRRPGVGRLNGSSRDAKINGGSLLRYTYVTPKFIAGMSMVAPLKFSEWTSISSQNRRNMILFNGDQPAKIFTQRNNPPNNKSVYNAEWGIQDKGVMILQLLPSPYSKSATGQLVYFSSSLKVVEEGGWNFVEAPEAYAAIKVVVGKATFREPTTSDFRDGKGDITAGVYLELENKLSPIIIEADDKVEYKNFSEFKEQILSNAMSYEGNVLKYASKAYGNELTLFADYSSLPKINDQTIDLEPPFAFLSPYLKASFGGGLVEILTDTNTIELNFQNATITLIPAQSSVSATNAHMVNSKELLETSPSSIPY